jgi:hypothetical protein
VLAEHGGPFEFSAEDFRRRVQWGKVSAKAADAISPSGNHRVDWDPHRVRIEPLIHKAKAGATLRARLVVSNPSAHGQKLNITLDGRGHTQVQTWDVEVAAGATVRRDVVLRLDDKLPAARHVFTLRVKEGERADGCDAFVAVDIE